MALEGRDINDGDIIGQTRQVANDKGHIQFQIDLPSGREVTSEWLNEDNRKKALLPWVEAVKREMVTDAEEVRAQARRSSQEAEKARQRALTSPSLTPSGLAQASDSASALTVGQLLAAGVASPLPVPMGAGISTLSTTPVAPSSDTAAQLSPDSFARNGLAQAKKDAEYWQEVAQGSMLKWQEAQTNVQKWESILAAISGGVVIQNVQTRQPEGQVIVSADSVNGSGDTGNRKPRKERSDKGKQRVVRPASTGV